MLILLWRQRPDSQVLKSKTFWRNEASGKTEICGRGKLKKSRIVKKGGVGDATGSVGEVQGGMHGRNNKKNGKFISLFPSLLPHPPLLTISFFFPPFFPTSLSSFSPKEDWVRKELSEDAKKYWSLEKGKLRKHSNRVGKGICRMCGFWGILENNFRNLYYGKGNRKIK